MQHLRHNILGVEVSVITMGDAIAAFRDWIAGRAAQYVCVTPAHAIMACWDEPGLRSVYNESGLTTPDGMGVVWLLRWAGHKRVSRVYGPDLLLEAFRHSETYGWRHYFYGGAPEVVEKLVNQLGLQYPGVKIVGYESPPFRELSPQEDDAVCARIREFGADLVWVGLGSPRQEIWMKEHVNKISAPVMIGVGAAFDFLSHSKPQAPGWVQRMGMEWFFRLLSEPKRLWKRYVLGYPRFVVLVLLQRLGLIKC